MAARPFNNRYAQHLRGRGPAAAVGFVLAFAGTTLVSGLFYADAFVIPLVAARAPELVGPPPFAQFLAPILPAILIPYGFCVLGVAIIGVAVLRSDALPRWTGALLILGLPFTRGPLVPRAVEIAAAVLFGTGLVALGHAQWVLHRTR